MWVKICANTSFEDAQAAVDFGADAVGFVFAPSRRQVNAAQVRAITRKLSPSVETVGVFAGDEDEAIASAVIEAGLTTIQLHGGVDLALTARLRQRLGEQIAIIHTAHWSVDDEAASAARVSAAMDEVAAQEVATQSDSSRLLIDAKVGGSSGGLGVSFNWEAARPIFAHAQGLDLRLILAGGLTPENIAEAVRTLRPWGVDVASGVEREAGRKDHARLKAFLANARAA